MDKNVLIAEMLYIFFVYYKGLGKHYKADKLKIEMKEALTVVKLLKKDSLSQIDIGHLLSFLDICGQYTRSDYSGIMNENFTGDAVDVDEPADKMCEIIEKVISESSGFFMRDKIALYLFALHNLPRAYMSDNIVYLGTHINRLNSEEAMSYCDEWLNRIN